ncbi:MAG: tetratricopeptide repeat protein, partial [Gammaproteobacteria bacterium]
MRRSPSPGTVGSAAKRRRAQEWLRAAFAEHQAGRLSDAEALYERVLARDPGQAQALHYLGMLCHQTGRPERAVDLLKKSVRAEPDPIVLNNLGGMLMEQERFAEATRFYGLAVQRRPDYI